MLRILDLAGVSTVGLAAQRPILGYGGPLKIQGIMPSKGQLLSIFLNSVLNLPVKKDEGKGRGPSL
jgi:hypothetical protein